MSTGIVELRRGRRSAEKNTRTKQRNQARKAENIIKEHARILNTQEARKKAGEKLSDEDVNFLKIHFPKEVLTNKEMKMADAKVLRKEKHARKEQNNNKPTNVHVVIVTKAS